MTDLATLLDDLIVAYYDSRSTRLQTLATVIERLGEDHPCSAHARRGLAVSAYSADPIDQQIATERRSEALLDIIEHLDPEQGPGLRRWERKVRFERRQHHCVILFPDQDRAEDLPLHLTVAYGPFTDPDDADDFAHNRGALATAVVKMISPHQGGATFPGQPPTRHLLDSVEIDHIARHTIFEHWVDNLGPDQRFELCRNGEPVAVLMSVEHEQRFNTEVQALRSEVRALQAADE